MKQKRFKLPLEERKLRRLEKRDLSSYSTKMAKRDAQSEMREYLTGLGKKDE